MHKGFTQMEPQTYLLIPQREKEYSSVQKNIHYLNIRVNENQA